MSKINVTITPTIKPNDAQLLNVPITEYIFKTAIINIITLAKIETIDKQNKQEFGQHANKNERLSNKYEYLISVQNRKVSTYRKATNNNARARTKFRICCCAGNGINGISARI